MSRIIQFIDRITENLRDGSDGITSTSRTKSPEKASSESSDSSERPESVKKYQAQIKYLRKMSLQKDDEILRLQNEIDSQNDLMSQTFTYSDEDADDSRTPEDLLRSLTTLSKFMQTERTAAFSKIESTDTPDWQSFSADEMKTLQGLLRQISCSRRTIECLETATKFPEIQDVEVLEESESTRGKARENTWDLGFEDYSTEFESTEGVFDVSGFSGESADLIAELEEAFAAALGLDDQDVEVFTEDGLYKYRITSCNSEDLSAYQDELGNEETLAAIDAAVHSADIKTVSMEMDVVA